jgi:hypothetical protein
MKRKQMMNLKSAYDDFCPFDTESTLQWLWTRKLEAYWKQELYEQLKKLDDPAVVPLIHRGFLSNKGS